jgi:hypothetical protein
MLDFDGDPVVLLRDYRMVWQLGELMATSDWRVG